MSDVSDYTLHSAAADTPTAETPATEATEKIRRPAGGVFGALQEAMLGTDGTAQAERARVRAEVQHKFDLGMIEQRSHEELDVLAHRKRIRRLAEREARGRANERMTAAVLLGVVGAEVAALLPLLTWGLWTGALWR